MLQPKVFKLNSKQVYEEQLKMVEKELEMLKSLKQLKLAKQEPSTIEESLIKLRQFRHFKRSIQLSPSKRSQTVLARNTYIDEQINVQTVFSFIPIDKEEEAEAYKQRLQEVYSGENLLEISQDDIQKFREHIVMAKIMNKWFRSQILTYVHDNGLIGIEDIDSGVQAIQNLAQHTFKVPRTDDMMQPAFASKVILDSMPEGSIAPGDCIEIRMTHIDPYGVYFAEAELEDVSEDFGSTQEVEGNNSSSNLIEPEKFETISTPEPPAERWELSPPVDLVEQKLELDQPDWEEENNVVVSKPQKRGDSSQVPSSKYYKRNKRHISEVKYVKSFTIKDIQMKEIPCGLKVKLFFVDGSEIEKGRIHVSGTPKNDWTFDSGYDFRRMEQEIVEHINTMSLGGHSPDLNELCLAKNNNGYYRAVCVNVKLSAAVMKFIDYGFVATVEFADLVKFPLFAIHPCFAHTVEFSLNSCLRVSTIDAGKSRKLLAQKAEITAEVRKHPKQPRKYTIILDDSYFVF